MGDDGNVPRVASRQARNESERIVNEVRDNPFHEVLGQLCNRRPMVKKKKVMGDGMQQGHSGYCTVTSWFPPLQRTVTVGGRWCNSIGEARLVPRPDPFSELSIERLRALKSWIRTLRP